MRGRHGEVDGVEPACRSPICFLDVPEFEHGRRASGSVPARSRSRRRSVTGQATASSHDPSDRGSRHDHLGCLRHHAGRHRKLAGGLRCRWPCLALSCSSSSLCGSSAGLRRADFPVLRAVEALVLTVLLFLVLFASIAVQLEAQHARDLQRAAQQGRRPLLHGHHPGDRRVWRHHTKSSSTRAGGHDDPDVSAACALGAVSVAILGCRGRWSRGAGQRAAAPSARSVRVEARPTEPGLDTISRPVEVWRCVTAGALDGWWSPTSAGCSPVRTPRCCWATSAPRWSRSSARAAATTPGPGARRGGTTRPRTSCRSTATSARSRSTSHDAAGAGCGPRAWWRGPTSWSRTSSRATFDRLGLGLRASCARREPRPGLLLDHRLRAAAEGATCPATTCWCRRSAA